MLELLEALARAANEAASPESAMGTCLDLIADYAHWDLGRVAILKIGANSPVVESSLWLKTRRKRHREFMRVSEDLSLSRAGGKFITVVLREKCPVWVEDFSKSGATGRLHQATKLGLLSGFAFPIIVQGEVAAFLEFFADKPRKADPHLIGAVEGVGAQLARLIERARAAAVHAQLAAIVEGSPDAIYSRSLDGTVLTWNTGAERMFGYTAAEMVGRPISMIVAKEFAHESQRNTDALLRGESVPPFEASRRAKDGHEVRVQVSVSPIRDASGRTRAIAAIMRDITEQDRADALREQLAAIVDSSDDAIFSIDLSGVIRTWNPGAERMLGYSAAEAIGRATDFLIPEDRAHEIGQRRAVTFSGRQAESHETVRLAKDGRRVDVSVSASPMRDGAGKTTGVALIYRNIIERKRAQHELEKRTALSQLMESLARAANEAASPEAAMRACLERICEHGNWRVGRLGIYGPGEGDRFPERSLWHTKERARFQLLTDASLDPKYFAAGGKFISVVLKDKRPIWIEDIASTPGFGRMSIALECGLRSAFAFPVIVAGEVAAFIEFFALEPRELDTQLLEAITSVGAQLARLIERAEADRARAQLAAIVENSDDAIASRDPERRIVTWNAAAERLFGYSAAEIIGKNVSVLIPPDQETQAAEARERLAAGKAIPAYDAVRLTKDGRRIDVSVSQSPIMDSAGRMTGVSLIFRDITQRKEAEERIRQLAHFDTLTGLPNRALFYDRLGQTIAFARRDQYTVALLYIDLDRFKAVNDTHGHDAGDALLTAVADRMRLCLRESDTIARVGGDEFIVILPKSSGGPDSIAVAKKLIEAFSAPFNLGHARHEVVISASIGIAAFPSDAEEMEGLIKAADSAMYHAKQSDNRFCFYRDIPRPEGT